MVLKASELDGDENTAIESRLEQTKEPIDSGGDPDIVEECSGCGEKTEAYVSVLLVQKTDESNAAYSREPYRVSQCVSCEYIEAESMNH